MAPGNSYIRGKNRTAVALLCALALLLPAAARGESSGTLVFCCSPGNDLFRAVCAGGTAPARFDGLAEAVEKAPEGAGVLYLADGYPERRNAVASSSLELARAKDLRLYLEFPEDLPERRFDPVTSTTWERLVAAEGAFGRRIPGQAILMASDCHYLPTTAPGALLSVARVAGYDRAVYGLPPSARPVLFEAPEYNALVATTCLSRFVSGRYGPAREWEELWKTILGRLGGGAGEPPVLRWKPGVRPALGPEEVVDRETERQTLARAAGWIFRSGLLLARERVAPVHALLREGGQEAEAPAGDAPGGDGSYGILEGYTSRIGTDGRQKQCLAIRADCQAESAMLLAAGAAAGGADPRSASVARNLLDFTYGPTGFCTGERADPRSAAYGHIAWGIVAPAWERGNYGDDNARVVLATLAAGALLGEGRWNAPALRAVAANFRTTGRRGFRGDRIDMPEFAQQGWKAFADRDLVNLSPHFESGLWACYLWAGRQTGYEPLLSRTRSAIRTTMEAYPSGWRWQDNMERARMLLCLAWLVRVDDTPEHRAWLDRVADDLLRHADASGAIPERLGGMGGGHYQVPATNEAFGTGESPLIQQNGDPASDQLYTTGFALLGLHEAAAATGEARFREAEDRLAAYLCRIQVRSTEHACLDGAWLRAFDFGRWDYWAASGDIGWGPWCAEAGWGQAWIGLTLGLRDRDMSLWQLLSAHDVKSDWKQVQAGMLAP